MAEGVALVGTGFIGPIHLEALRRAGRRVVGVLGSSPDKSRQAAAALGLVRGYDDYAALLADPEVGAVHITSPNRLHFAQARDALNAGKHVVCEKPLAMDSTETADLVRQAAATDRVAAVCYNVRFYPLCHHVRGLIQDGALGTIHHVRGAYVQDWLLKDTDFNWRVLAEEGGPLRAVADIGTHWLDLVQWLVGQNVAEVCADLHTVLPVRQRPLGSVETFSGKLGSAGSTQPVAVTTEDYGSLLLHFAGGARGALTISQVTAGRKNHLHFEIAGSKGAVAWNSERPDELWLGRRDEPNAVLLRDPALLHPLARPLATTPGGHPEGFADTFKQLFRCIYAAAEGSTDLPRTFADFRDGHREALLCEAILRSHRERGWIPVSA